MDGIDRRELRVPMSEAGLAGLEALLVFPNDGARHPLALLSHGSPRSAADRSEMTPYELFPQAVEIARRGWATAVVLRRGYGLSGGGWAESYGTCEHPDYLSAGRAAAADLRTAVAFLAKQPEVDASRILALGHSAGGFATVALAADPPAGLIGAVSFAGGRGSLSADTVCDGSSLVEAFREFGKHSTVPMLWVYSENDHFFGPALARRLHEAFASGGDTPRLASVPPFEDDGHALFTRGIALWTPLLDEFLASIHATQRPQPIALPAPPHVNPPSGLSKRGQDEFERFLLAPPHRAFAVSEKGAWGWRSSRRTSDDACAAALKNCGEESCHIVMLDAAPVSNGVPCPRAF